MKPQSGSICIAQLFLQPRRRMLVSVQRHAPAALPSGKRPGTLCTEGWLGPRAGLDGYGKSRPNRESIPDRPIRSTECECPSFYGSCLKNSYIYIYIYIYIHYSLKPPTMHTTMPYFLEVLLRRNTADRK
jgi:hypothetical protein